MVLIVICYLWVYRELNTALYNGQYVGFTNSWKTFVFREYIRSKVMAWLVAGTDWPMTGTSLASCPQCSPMAQGGLVLMAGMVALVITQSDKGGHQCAGIVWLSWMVGMGLAGSWYWLTNDRHKLGIIPAMLTNGTRWACGNGWYGCPSHSPKRQGRASG